MEGLFVALISGGVTLSVCLINNYYQSNATRKLLEYRLSELERKVDKHNNLVERTYELEKAMKLQEEKIKVANNRILDLEKEIKHE